MKHGGFMPVPALDFDWIGHGLLIWPVRTGASAEILASQQDCLLSGLADPVAAGTGARQQTSLR